VNEDQAMSDRPKQMGGDDVETVERDMQAHPDSLPAAGDQEDAVIDEASGVGVEADAAFPDGGTDRDRTGESIEHPGDGPGRGLGAEADGPVPPE
jgi:hypothetical protein